MPLALSRRAVLWKLNSMKKELTEILSLCDTLWGCVCDTCMGATPKHPGALSHYLWNANLLRILSTALASLYHYYSL